MMVDEYVYEGGNPLGHEPQGPRSSQVVYRPLDQPIWHRSVLRAGAAKLVLFQIPRGAYDKEAEKTLTEEDTNMAIGGQLGHPTTLDVERIDLLIDSESLSVLQEMDKATVSLFLGETRFWKIPVFEMPTVLFDADVPEDVQKLIDKGKHTELAIQLLRRRRYILASSARITPLEHLIVEIQPHEPLHRDVPLMVAIGPKMKRAL